MAQAPSEIPAWFQTKDELNIEAPIHFSITDWYEKIMKIEKANNYLARVWDQLMRMDGDPYVFRTQSGNILQPGTEFLRSGIVNVNADLRLAGIDKKIDDWFIKNVNIICKGYQMGKIVAFKRYWYWRIYYAVTTCDTLGLLHIIPGDWKNLNFMATNDIELGSSKIRIPVSSDESIDSYNGVNLVPNKLVAADIHAPIGDPQASIQVVKMKI